MKALIYFALSLVLMACAPARYLQPGDPDYLDQRTLVFQACVGKHLLFENGVLNIRTVTDSSYGGGAVLPKIWSTSNQPVFMNEMWLRWSPKGILLLGRQRMSYLFLRPPSRIFPGNSWTDWQSAAAIYANASGRGIESRLMYGDPLPPTDFPPPEDILVRWREMTLKDYSQVRKSFESVERREPLSCPTSIQLSSHP